MLGREVVELDEIGLRALRHGEDTGGRTNRARHHAPEHGAILPAHELVAARERDVVHRDDCGARAAKGHGVLRVHEVGSDPAEKPRQAPGHAQLLRAGREHDRLDALGHEVGPARDCDESDTRGRDEAAQLAQEVHDVRLVPRALPAEHVGVERDDLHASSLHSSTTESAARAQLKPLRSREAGGHELVASVERVANPPRDRGDVERVDEDRRTARDLLHRRRLGRHDGRTARHRLQHGQAEALVQRRVEHAAGAAIQGRQLRVRDLPHPPVDLDASPPTCADDPQLDSGLTRGVHGSGEVLPRLERCDREHVVAVGARAVRAEHGVDAVWDHADPLGRDACEIDRLAAAELGDGDDRIGSVKHAPQAGAAVEPMPARERLGRAEDREVVHRQDRSECPSAQAHGTSCSGGRRASERVARDPRGTRVRPG